MAEPAPPGDGRKPGGQLLPFRRGGRGDPDLPAVRGQAAPDVLQGQVVDDVPPRTIPLRVIRVVTGAARHEHARTGARHAAYVGIGATVLLRRLWDSRSTARHERSIRAAEASGDRDGALQWEERLAQFRKDRHARRVAAIELPVKILKDIPKIIAGFAAVLAVLGVLLAIATRSPRGLITPVVTLAKVTEVISAVISAAWAPVLLAAPLVMLIALWRTGRRHARALSTGWLAAPRADEEDAGIVVTADTIVLALQHLDGIPALKKAFRDGWRPTFHTLPVRDGEGYFSVFSVPLGVTAEMIADKNAVFARNLHRAKVETWPTDAERDKIAPAGYVALWVANPGVLDRPAPEWPLLHEGTADVFKGVPAGVSPRGDAISVPVVANNFAIGGMMGQGKSNACRVIFLGAALDPLAELRVHVFAYNGDFDSYAPRLARYVKGAEEAQILAAMGTLDELYEEVSRREKRLSELGAKKVTRDLATRYPDLRPLLTLFSECHELFGHKDYGEEATDQAVSVIRKARKCAIWMGFDTQDSRKDAIPPKLVNLVSVNGCFYVKGHQANDGFLGAGSFRAGIRATELRPGRDIGRSLVTGVSDAQFEILKWHYIFSDDDTGQDDAAAVIARAVANLTPGIPAGGASQVPAIETRDLLDDLDEAIGGVMERVSVNDLPAQLRALAPAWGPYRNLTGTQLRALLGKEGVRVTNTGNVPRLDPADLRQVIMRQATEDLDEE